MKRKVFKVYHHLNYWLLRNNGRKEVIKVLSIRRSGQHGIINWIQAQKPGTIGFYNNVFPNQHLFVSSNNQESKLRLLEKGNCLICNIENPHLDDLRVHGLGKYQKLTNLLILRDPFNCFASYLNARWAWDTNFQDRSDYRTYIKNLWKSHAKEALGYTNYLENRLVVNYNSWVSDSNYRKKLAKQLNLPFSDAGFDVKPHYGQGSSFDNASSNYLKRWEHFAKNEDFLKIFRHDYELQELSTLLFGRQAGTDKLFS